jgi:hypothetical protein
MTMVNAGIRVAAMIAVLAPEEPFGRRAFVEIGSTTEDFYWRTAGRDDAAQEAVTRW